MKKAIITGITGQDAAYLAELLLDKGYKVYGTYRRTSSTNFWRIEELGVDKHPNLELIEFDYSVLSIRFQPIIKNENVQSKTVAYIYMYDHCIIYFIKYTDIGESLLNNHERNFG